MTPPPHTMQLAGRADRALTIAIHDALRRDLERHGGRTEHGCPRSSPCPSSADAGCEDPAR
jgi:hypothetical protein